MQLEQDWSSASHDSYVCPECYKGPPPEEPDYEPDDFGPRDGLLHI